MNNQQVYCQVRRTWIAASPEEQVRQRLLLAMLHQLGYPAELIIVEKAIHQLPHLAAANKKNIPDRRVDIMCYKKGVHPLLVVECKAVSLTWRVINQVLGYNQVIRSPFVAIANDTEVRTGWFDGASQQWSFVDYLPRFQELESAVD